MLDWLPESLFYETIQRCSGQISSSKMKSWSNIIWSYDHGHPSLMKGNENTATLEQVKEEGSEILESNRPLKWIIKKTGNENIEMEEKRNESILIAGVWIKASPSKEGIDRILVISYEFTWWYFVARRSREVHFVSGIPFHHYDGKQSE